MKYIEEASFCRHPVLPADAPVDGGRITFGGFDKDNCRDEVISYKISSQSQNLQNLDTFYVQCFLFACCACTIF